ncbi:MAG: Uncharacterised protein [Opitutia bacterium UBA7350]|nr:MAG: Uncharacterised protein [Opitutae bacterium UBA7350]
MSSLKRLLWLVPLVPLFLANAGEPKRLIILANSASGDSLSLARFYAEKRSVPKSNIIALPMPLEETISVEEYVERIHNPLLEVLLERGLISGGKASTKDAYGRNWLRVGIHDVGYLVPVYGVPLRISNDDERMAPDGGKMMAGLRFNRAAVDSELALLARPGHRSMAAYSQNGFFKEKEPSTDLLRSLLRVSRLDGPNVKAVRSLIERTLDAEAVGLQGRAYFDLGGPHKQGDEWFRQAIKLVKNAYFDTTIEPSKRLLDERDRFDEPAIYMGWYKPHAYGNFKIANWNVPPGALALHLHSFSATTVRNTNRYWLGALLEMGFCATVGNVYEPYLQYTHYPHLLLECLLEGGTFGEAAAYSIPVFSWMGVAIGDPLYRPFKNEFDSPMSSEKSAYAIIREANRINSNVSDQDARSYLHDEFRRSPSLALAYALASRYADAGKNKEAREVLRIMEHIQIYAKEDQVLVQALADLQAQVGEREKAFKTYERLLSQEKIAKSFKISLLAKGSVLARKLGSIQIAEDWERICSILSGSAEKK